MEKNKVTNIEFANKYYLCSRNRNKNMNTKFTIKNFRVFDENGVDIELKPLTILTGCNSSGKSSIARAALLLDSFLTQIKKSMDNGDSIDFNKYKIDFTTYPNNLFGTFDNVVPKGSSLRQITLGYTVYSLMLSKDVDVQLVFSSEENDKIKNAYLISISMSIDGKVFYSSSKSTEEGTNINLSALKEACIDFLPIEFVVDNYCGLESEYEFGHSISKEEYEDQHNKMLAFLRECDIQRRTDIIRYARTTKVKESIMSRCKANPEILTWTIENNSLFMIPVIEWLNSLKKEETEAAVDKFLYNESEAMIAASKRIIKDYMASDCTSFNDYFRQYEQNFLADAKMSFFPKKKTPRLIDAHDLNINQDYVLMDTFNASKDFIDFDGNKSKPRASKEKLMEEHRNTSLSFHIIYEIVMAWNAKFSQEEESVYYSNITTEMGSAYHCHMMYSLLTHFAADLLREVICPDWCGNMEYVRSDRAIVKRLYTLESNDDFTILLKQYLEAKRIFIGNNDNSLWSHKNVYEADRFVNKWIEKFGVAKSLELRVEAEGWGLTLRNGDNGRLLADEGHGITQLVSILLQIEMAILSAKGEKVNRYWGLDNLDGYGKKGFHYEINTIVIEEPEIHLHPRYQSWLAEMFVDAYENYNIHFIIETHSEYLIRKLQTLVATKIIDSKQTSIAYVYDLAHLPLYTPQVKTIGISEDGRLMDSFGSGFFDEADNLALNLLSPSHNDYEKK